MSQWSVEPVFGWLAVIPLALIMLASLWLTMTAQGLGWLARAWLLFLRMLAISLLLLGWLRPGLVKNVERESDAAVAVLIDASQSMTMPSGSGEKTRWMVAREIWQAIESQAKSGFGKTKFIPFLFDSSLKPVPQNNDLASSMNATWNKPPSGLATDLGSALAELQTTQIDPPIRSVIMLTDGTQTMIPALADATLVARQYEMRDQPIVIVGLGARSENSQLRDLALEGAPEHVVAFEKNRVTVPAVLRTRGMQNTQIKIAMTLKSSGQPDIPLKSVEVLPGQPNQTLPLNLGIEAPKSGEYLLEIIASIDGNELITSNNSTFSFMTVREGGSRILYIEGQPRHEQTFLKRSLKIPDFQVEWAWIPEITRNRWPVDLTKEHNFDIYDAFILGDVDARALGPVTLTALRRRIDRGAGLLTLGGYHSYDAGSYAGSPLADVLPVTLIQGRSQGFDKSIAEDLHVAGPVAMVPIVPHPITHLAMEPDNTKIWKGLEPLLGANRLGKIKNAPGVQVIAASAKSEPLLVTGEFGRGRVLSFAGDSTYQWWMHGEQLRHKQFWRQSVLWLLGRDSLQVGFRLVLDRRRLLRGEEETVGIEWVGGNDNKPMPKELSIELIHDGKWLRALESQPTSDNRRQVRLKELTDPGLYRMVLKATGEDGKSYTNDVAFIVKDESREMNSPNADWQQMQNIASATSRVGGRVIMPDALEETLQWLRQRQASARVTTLEKRRLGDSTWDAWLYFVLFCGTLTLEWTCRKKWQLP